MRVALYHRVSTLDQNPELARDELRAAAARLGTVALDVEETGSGARADRPGLAQVMDAARRGSIDVVCVWKLDRFGRSAPDLLANVRELEARGVRFIATTQGLDTGQGAVARLILTILAGVAEFERELIRERTVLGHAEARRKGKHIGRPKVQLSRAVIDRAIELRGKNFRPWHSWRQIRKVLQAEGVANLPSHGAIAAACQKVSPELPRGDSGWPRSYRR